MAGYLIRKCDFANRNFTSAYPIVPSLIKNLSGASFNYFKDKRIRQDNRIYRIRKISPVI